MKTHNFSEMRTTDAEGLLESYKIILDGKNKPKSNKNTSMFKAEVFISYKISKKNPRDIEIHYDFYNVKSAR
jgi:hypothetical protein